MSAVYTSNLVIYTNTDFEQVFVLEDTASNSVLNLSNYVGSAQFKKYKSSSLSGTFLTQITNGDLGKVRIQLGADETKTIKPGKYFYDLNITNTVTGEKIRVIEGTILVKKAITR
jgi:hypothetical protein